MCLGESPPQQRLILSAQWPTYRPSRSPRRVIRFLTAALVLFDFQLVSLIWRLFSAHHSSGSSCSRPPFLYAHSLVPCVRTHENLSQVNPIIMNSLTSGNSNHKEEAMSSSSCEHGRDRSPAQLQHFPQDCRLSITGRARSMSPLPIHHDKAEHPSIDIILDSSTPVNSVSRTNSIASSSTTLVSYDSPCSATHFSSLSRLCGQQEEPHPLWNSVVEPRPPFEVPIRSFGQRIESWPHVSGSSARALNYQEAIRLVRYALDFSSRDQPLMARQTHQPTSNLFGGDNVDGVSDAVQAHPPLTIRQRRRATENVGQTDALKQEVAAFCLYANLKQESSKQLNDKENNTLNHVENSSSHYTSAEDTANVLEEASIRTSDPTEEPISHTHASPSLAKSNTTSPHPSHMPSVRPDGEVTGYRPRIGGKPRKDARCPPHAGQKTTPKECPGLNVDPDPILKAVYGDPDASSSLVQNAKAAITSTEDNDLRHDQIRAKRSSCHDM